MPLRDVLRNVEDRPPGTARLVANITQIMDAERPDSDLRYRVDEVLTAVVYAVHDLSGKRSSCESMCAYVSG